MKYFIGISIALIGLFVFGVVLETKYSFALKIVFSIVFFVIDFFWEFSVLNRNFESDFKIRSQKKTMSIFDIGVALFWTLYILFLTDFKESLSFLIFVFWVFPISEFIMRFLYKAKKPYTILVKDNELILNKRWIKKRKLSKLNQIQFDRFNKNLKLVFEKKTAISFKTTEYKIEDIQSLIAILIDKSENKVILPENYKYKKVTNN